MALNLFKVVCNGGHGLIKLVLARCIWKRAVLAVPATHC